MPISQKFLYLQKINNIFLKSIIIYLVCQKSQKSVESFILKNANQKHNQHAYKQIRWPVPLYVRVGYDLIRVFQNERFNRFLLFFASLINNNGTLRKFIFFLIGIKTFEISAYIFNIIFTKNENNFEIPRQIFP